jgi:hypothetical protein
MTDPRFWFIHDAKKSDATGIMHSATVFEMPEPSRKKSGRGK